MNVLYFVRNIEHLRYTMPMVETLLNTGNIKVHLVFTYPSDYHEQDLILSYRNKYGNKFSDFSIPIIKNNITKVAYFVSNIVDILHFKIPVLNKCVGINNRLKLHNINRIYARFINKFFISALFVKQKILFLRWVLYLISSNDQLYRIFKEIEPDVAIFTGLVYPNNLQFFYLNILKKLGVQTSFLVNSWDNLSNKGDIKCNPDTIYVWNDTIKAECSELHYINLENIVVVGSVAFERLFNLKPLAEIEFKKSIGLSDDKKYILYLGSSPNIVTIKREISLLTEFCKKLSDIRSELIVIFRTHPNQNIKIDTSLDNLIVEEGVWMYNVDSYTHYYNLLAYSYVVCSVNSSSMIEAGYFGKTIFTINLKSQNSMQDDTYHYRYLKAMSLLNEFNDVESAVVSILSDDTNKNCSYIAANVNAFIFKKNCKPSELVLFDILGSTPNAKNSSIAYKLFELFFTKILIFVFSVGVFLSRLFRKNYILRLTKKTNNQELNTINVFKPQYDYLVSTGNIRCSKKLLDLEALGKREIIIIGPWLGEIGFELLYWIPFVRYVLTSFNKSKDKVVVISRGGNFSWYSDIANKYLNIYDHYTTEQITNIQNERILELGHQKQSVFTNTDLNIIKSFFPIIKLKYGILDPSYMYSLFSPYFSSDIGISYPLSFTKFRYNIREKRNPKIYNQFPTEYICVKFYFRETFPDTIENRKFIDDVVNYFGKTYAIINLSHDFKVDDHRAPEITHPNVYPINSIIDNLKNNIEIQTEIIENSKLFIGTYGGFSYLANLSGVPSICFVSNHETKSTTRHVDFANQALSSFADTTKIFETHTFRKIFLESKL